MGSPNSYTAEHRWIATNGIRLHVLQAGPNDGPLVILLHGFPEFWYGWRYQIPYLASAGYRVWAPDQRGYNLSDKPAGIAAYRIDVLAADVRGLVKAAGREAAFLVGHDWGGAVAWWAAAHYPQSVDRMVVINAPHGAVMGKHLLHNPAQLLRSWYIFFFQIPWLPEAVARLGDWKIGVKALRQSSRPNTFSDADLELYKQAWSQPKACTCMFSWYRAIMQALPRPPSHLSVPTLLIWGARDRFLGREMAQQSIDLCSEGRLVVIEEATHWVQHEEAERVNTLIADFLCSRDR
jgi:pimeloyl-ACP methyl ester carboxylesterase